MICTALMFSTRKNRQLQKIKIITRKNKVNHKNHINVFFYYPKIIFLYNHLKNSYIISF